MKTVSFISSAGTTLNRLRRFLYRLPSPASKFFWLFILLIIKALVLYFEIRQERPTSLPGTIAVCSGDCEGYLQPVDALLETGRYEPDYRMPGYGLPYLLFRLFVPQNTAVNLLVLFQTVFDAVAALLLCLTMFRITKRIEAFYLTFLFYGIGVSVSCYNNWILTESMTCSTFVTGLYFLFQFQSDRRARWLFWAGLFFAWAYFLRPVNAGILVLAAMALFALLEKNIRWENVAVFLLPALIFNACWTARNYFAKNKFFVLTENAYSIVLYGEHGFAMLNFCKTFSDFKVTYSFFDGRGLSYFGQAVNTIRQDDIYIPDDIYTPDFNRDSLLRLRDLYSELARPDIDGERSEVIRNTLTEKFNLYTESVKRHHPFIAYVRTPLLLAWNFVLQSGVHNLYFYPYNYLSGPQQLIKLFFVIIYFGCFMLFMTGIFFYREIFKNKLILASYAIAFYIIFIHAIILRSIESRYIIPAYPFFVAGAVYTWYLLLNKIKKFND